MLISVNDYSSLSNNFAAQFIIFLRKIHPAYPYSILHVLLICMKLPACALFHLANIGRLLDFLNTFLLKIFKIIFLQSFVLINLKIFLPLLILVKESEGCF